MYHTAIIISSLSLLSLILLSSIMISINQYEYTHYRTIYNLLIKEGFELRANSEDKEDNPLWDTVDVYQVNNITTNIITFDKITKQITIGEYLLSRSFPDILDPIQQFWRFKYWLFFHKHIKPQL